MHIFMYINICNCLCECVCVYLCVCTYFPPKDKAFFSKHVLYNAAHVPAEANTHTRWNSYLRKKVSTIMHTYIPINIHDVCKCFHLHVCTLCCAHTSSHLCVFVLLCFCACVSKHIDV